MNRYHPLLGVALVAIVSFILFAAKKPLGKTPDDLLLQGIATAAMNPVTEVSITGNGFDEQTRLFLTRDSGNRRALVNSFPTWGNLENVAVAGNLLYLANNYRGMQVVDFSDANRPRQIGTLPLPGRAQAIAVRENLACVAGGEAGLHIVDIGNPRQPRLLTTVLLGGLAVRVTLAGNLAYVANLKSGLQVVAVTDPANPRLIATLAVAGHAYDLVAENENVYLAAGKGGLQIFDVRNPRKPRLKGHWETPETAFGIALHSGIAYVAAGRAGLIVVDVHSPQAPKWLGTVASLGTARSIAIGSGLAYLATSLGGLQVIDITDPKHPFAAGVYDLPGNAIDVVLGENHALVSTGRSGLQIIDRHQVAITPAGEKPLTPAKVLSTAKGKREFFPSGYEIIVVQTNDLSAEIVARIPTEGSSTEVQVAGDFLYVQSVVLTGPERKKKKYQIEVIDIADLQNPRATNFLSFLNKPVNLLAVGEDLWVVGQDGLCRYDLKYPAAPRWAGCLPLSDTGISLAIKDELLLVGGRNGTLSVINVADPENLYLLGEATLPWHLQPFATLKRIVVDGSLALVAGGRNGLLIYSIADPQQPQLIGGRQLPDGNYASGLAIRGGIAYLSDILHRLHLFDFSNPQQLQLLATISNQAASRNFVIAGDQIVSATKEGVHAFPLPVELTDIQVEGPAQLKARIPAWLLPGNYSLWAASQHRCTELPGALLIGDQPGN